MPSLLFQPGRYHHSSHTTTWWRWQLVVEGAHKRKEHPSTSTSSSYLTQLLSLPNSFPHRTRPRADIDPCKMIRHYFCRRRRFRARRTRTPNPVVLVNFSADVANLVDAIARGRDLHYEQVIYYAGSVQKSVHSIGWNAAGVKRLAMSTARVVQQAFWIEE